MIILAIDTTGQTAATALVDESHTLAEFTVTNKKTHSVILMPMIDQLMTMSEISLEDVDYIACAQGPGSFTGLRIGAAAAKALAHGLNTPMVPVPTLDGLAYNVYSPGSIIIPLMDARRNQVYTAFYTWVQDRLKRLTDYTAMALDQVLEQASEIFPSGKSAASDESAPDFLTAPSAYKQILFLGDGAEIHREEILAYNKNFLLAPGNMNLQRAASIGALAVKLIKNESPVLYHDFGLFYLRKPQAEQEKS